MSDLLKAMNILGNGQFIEIKGEQLYNVPDYKVDEVLQDAMKKVTTGTFIHRWRLSEIQKCIQHI